MPYASDTLINWANGVLSTGNFHARRDLFIKNPILPPSGGIRLADIGHAGANFGDVVRLDYTKLKIGAAVDSIKFIKLRPNEKNEVGAMTFVMKSPDQLATTASRIGWTAIWWLPWQNKHIVKIKIRTLATDANIAPGGGIDPIPNPGVFVTAAINGCSVFAVGDTKFPSVYHGGSDGAVTVRVPTETTEQAWERLLGRVGGGKNVQGVGKTDYVAELDPGGTDLNDRVKSGLDNTTNQAIALEQELIRRGTLTNISVSPWGMVFGLRDVGGDWTMSLVKNAFVTYKRIKVIQQKRFMRKPLPVTVHEGEFRDVRTYNADGVPTIRAAINEQAIQTCVTLGYQDFFPGRGAVSLYNLATIAIF
jgi:hypothetical protein